MKSSSEQIVCGDAPRRLFFERVGRYFEHGGDDKRIDGACEICGMELKDAVNASGSPTCRPQRSIAKERPRPAEGAPVAFDSPVKPGAVKNKMTTGCITLIAPDRTFVAANLLPTMPLPAEMTAVPVAPGVQARFLKEFMRNPPRTPFLLALWDKKLKIPLVMTESLSRTMICGGDVPRMVDMTQVMAASAIAGKLGLKRFKEACWLRERIARETDPAKIAKSNDELDALMAAGLTIAEFNRLPPSQSTVQDLALRALGEEQAPSGDDAEAA